LVAKELVGRLQPEGSGRRVDVQMDTGDRWLKSWYLNAQLVISKSG